MLGVVLGEPMRVSRRQFLVGVVASGSALIAGGCGDGAADDATGNQAPLWAAIPSITFVQGIASSFSIAEYVSDADEDELMLSLDDAPLPAGVTFDAAGMRFVYDGSGPPASSTHMITADDGRA